jgi:hypothetical protein
MDVPAGFPRPPKPFKSLTRSELVRILYDRFGMDSGVGEGRGFNGMRKKHGGFAGFNSEDSRLPGDGEENTKMLIFCSWLYAPAK